MTVKKLISLLKKEDPKRVVVLSSDSEGNSFSLLADLVTSAYREDEEGYNKVGLEKLTPALREMGYTEEDIVPGKPALILYPNN